MATVSLALEAPNPAKHHLTDRTLCSPYTSHVEAPPVPDCHFSAEISPLMLLDQGSNFS
jgi:hypothetical protein